jgi:nucleoside-diphosphate-sugar epimerase
MEAAARAKVGSFLLMSSVKAIGEEHTGNFNADAPPRPTTPHGRSKLAAEQAMFKLAIKHGVKAVALRLPMVYGPGVKGNVLRLLKSADMDKKLPFGRVVNQRSMVYVDNVVDAALCALEAPASAGKVYIVCDPRPYGTAELYTEICRAMGKKPLLRNVPVWALWVAAGVGDAAQAVLRRRMPVNSYAFVRIVGDLCFDSTKIKRDLGWSPKVSLEEGISKTVQWYRQGCPPAPPA